VLAREPVLGAGPRRNPILVEDVHASLIKEQTLFGAPRAAPLADNVGPDQPRVAKDPQPSPKRPDVPTRELSQLGHSKRMILRQDREQLSVFLASEHRVIAFRTARVDTSLP